MSIWPRSELPLAVSGFVLGDEILKDLTLLLVGRFRKSLAEQSQVLVMNEFVHGRAPRWTGTSTTELAVTDGCLERANDRVNIHQEPSTVGPGADI